MTPRRPTRGFEPGDDVTPPPTPRPLELADVQGIAERESDAAADRHANYCRAEGEAAKLWGAYEKLEARMRTVETEQAVSRGSVQETAKSGQRMVALVAAIGVAVQLAAFLANHWPRK